MNLNGQPDWFYLTSKHSSLNQLPTKNFISNDSDTFEIEQQGSIYYYSRILFLQISIFRIILQSNTQKRKII